MLCALVNRTDMLCVLVNLQVDRLGRPLGEREMAASDALPPRGSLLPAPPPCVTHGPRLAVSLAAVAASPSSSRVQLAESNSPSSPSSPSLAIRPLISLNSRLSRQAGRRQPAQPPTRRAVGPGTAPPRRAAAENRGGRRLSEA
jgi:hypothetical protein